MDNIKYDSFCWAGDAEKSCSCAIGILEKIQNLKENKDYLYLLDEIKNVQTCINEMEKEILLEMNCNYDECLCKLENTGILSYLNKTNRVTRYRIKGLEHVCDSRCKGWTLIGAGNRNEITLKCSRIRLQELHDNQSFSTKINQMLADAIGNTDVSWYVESYLLIQEKHSTSASVYITFIF